MIRMLFFREEIAIKKNPDRLLGLPGRTILGNPQKE